MGNGEWGMGNGESKIPISSIRVNIAVFSQVRTIVRSRSVRNSAFAQRVREHKHLARVFNDTIVRSVLSIVNTAINCGRSEAEGLRYNCGFTAFSLR